jgi:rhomboid protease GluP
MDLNRIALWFAALPALSLLWRSARGPIRAPDWILVSSFVLLTGAVGLLLFPDSAGYAALLVALVFMVLPVWARAAAGRANGREQFGRARLLSGLGALFHPSLEFRVAPRILLAFELAYRGQLAEAETLLQLVARDYPRVAPTVLGQRLRLLGRWRELKSLGEREGLLSLCARPNLFVLYARALGELGLVDDLAELLIAEEASVAQTAIRDAVLLYLFAFAGQVELTGQLLADKQSPYSDDTRASWLAIANQSAGRTEEARRAFGRLRSSKQAQVRRLAEERFSALLHAEPELPPTPRTLAIVQHFARAFKERQRFTPRSLGARASPMTLSLVASNTAVFVIGSFPRLLDTRAEFADRWAFFAPEIFRGQWWRTLSYLFVHANAVHLLMNLGGLWVLGPTVERAFGRARFAVIYLVSGCTGSAAYLLLTRLGWIDIEPLVGASGCIMGLLGASAASTLRAWLRHRARLAKQIFFRLLAVVLLQVAFDYTTPQVAGLAHGLGLIGGFLCALLFRELGPSSQRGE